MEKKITDRLIELREEVAKLQQQHSLLQQQLNQTIQLLVAKQGAVNELVELNKPEEEVKE